MTDQKKTENTIVAEASRIALLGIIIEKNQDFTQNSAAEEVNLILHQFNAYVVGRMGIPYKEKGVAIISVIIDAPNNIISSLSGKLGMISGISVKTMYSKTSS